MEQIQIGAVSSPSRGQGHGRPATPNQAPPKGISSVWGQQLSNQVKGLWMSVVSTLVTGSVHLPSGVVVKNSWKVTVSRSEPEETVWKPGESPANRTMVVLCSPWRKGAHNPWKLTKAGVPQRLSAHLDTYSWNRTADSRPRPSPTCQSVGGRRWTDRLRSTLDSEWQPQ